MEVVIKNKLQYKFSQLCLKLIKYIPQNVTPNEVTVFGLIATILGSAAFALSRLCRPLIIFSLVAVVVHLFADDIDGHMARERNMCSPQGEVLDLLSDVVFAMLNVFALGISGYCHPEICFFFDVFYGFMLIVFMYIEKFCNEEYFTEISPLDGHLAFLAVFAINLFNLNFDVFTVSGITFTLTDVVVMGACVGLIVVLIALLRHLFSNLAEKRQAEEEPDAEASNAAEAVQ